MGWREELDQTVRDYLPDLKMENDVPMSRCTSFRIGGPAARLAYPDSGAQLVLLVDFANRCGARPLVIGNGSNLLAADEGLDRLVIATGSLTKIKNPEPTLLEVQAGVPLVRLAVYAQKRGLTGLEFAHGIPGTLGGAICMNAGAYDGEIKQVAESAVLLNPEEGIRTLQGEELDFGYRHSVLNEHPDWIVLSASLRLRPGDPAAIREKMAELMARRRKSQPLEYPSAGSTFKRPEGQFAGTLIDRCGLKGLTVGDAQVSEKHAGFLINRGNASFADMTELIRRVQDTVYTQTGVRLEPEVKILRD